MSKIPSKFLIIVFILVIILISYIVPTHFYTVDCAEILAVAKYTYSNPQLLFSKPITYTKPYDIESSENQFRFLERLIPTLIYLAGKKNLIIFHVSLVILFIGTSIYIYKLSKLLSNKYGGIISSLLFLTSPITLYVITDIGYIATWMESFFIVSGIFYSLQALEKNRIDYLVRGLLFGIFAYLSKEPSRFIFPIILLSFLILKYRRKLINNKLAIFIIIFSLISLFLLIGTPFFIIHFTYIEAKWSELILGAVKFNMTYYWTNWLNNYKFTLITLVLLSLFLYKNGIIASFIWLIIAFVPTLFWIYASERFIYPAFIALCIFVGASSSSFIIWVRERNHNNLIFLRRKLIVLLLFLLLIMEMGMTTWLNLKNINKLILLSKQKLKKTQLVIERIKNNPQHAKIIIASGELAYSYYTLMRDFLGRYDIHIDRLNEKNLNLLKNQGLIGDNLIKNSDFENDLESWDTNIKGIISPGIHGKALRVEYEGKPENFCHISQTIPVKKGADYIFGGLIKMQNLLFFGCIEVQSFQGWKEGCWRTLVWHNDKNWFYDTGHFNSGDDGLIRFFPIRIPIFMQGEMLVDDIFLCEIYKQNKIDNIYLEYDYDL